MSYLQNTPFQTNCVYLNTKDSKKQGSNYNFNLNSSLRCPLNTNFVVSVQDCEIPNTFNNITKDNNRLQFKINHFNLETINFAGVGVTGGISEYTTFLNNNNFDFWNIDRTHTTAVVDGVSYKPVYRNGSGTGYIRKYLPNYNGLVTIVFQNNYTQGVVEFLVGGVVKKSLSAGSAVTTYSTFFTPNQLLQVQETGSVGVMLILSISTLATEPVEEYPFITFPPNYYNAFTFRDYFNANFASQNPLSSDLITLEYDKFQYKYSFTCNEFFEVTNQERLHKNLDFAGLTTTTLFQAFCNANNLAFSNLSVNTTLTKNQIAYPSLTGATTISQLGYSLPNYNGGRLTIRLGLSSGTGGIKLSLNNIQEGSLITTSDEVRVITFEGGDVFRVERNNNNFVIYSLDIVETGIDTIPNPCSDVIGLSKDNDRNFIYPERATDNPQWTIRMPSIINFLPTSHIFIRFSGFSMNNLNSNGDNDNTLVRVPVNSSRGNIIFYRPTELIRFMIPKKNINSFNLEVVDSKGNEIDLGGAEFQVNLRFDYHYPEELKDIEEGSINHTLTKLSKELPDEPPNKEQGLG